MQLDALERVGVDKVFSEKVSAVGKRPELARLLSVVKEGDEVVVYKLDRLARSLKHLLEIVERLECAGCGLRSVTEAIDTRSLAGRMMLQVLGAMAEFERGLICERVTAGVRAAKARGVTLGRPRVLSREAEREMVELMERERLSYAEVGALYGVSAFVVNNAVQRVRRARGDPLKFRRRKAGE